MDIIKVNPGMPYPRLARNVRLLKNYISEVPASINNEAVLKQTLKDLQILIREIGRKPNICFLGPFDAGKSTLINALLGKSNLHVSLQPTTSIPSFIRHISDRPQWMHDEVWIMNSSFNPAFWEDRDHCLGHKVQGGGVSILRDYGTHQGVEDGRACYALVFLNSPILHACNLIDFPGYDNDDADTAKATSYEEIADIVFYLSPLQGFLKSVDNFRIGQILRKLPPFEAVNISFPTLGSLFIVASHVNPDQYTHEDVKDVFSRSTERLWKQIGETAIPDREKLINRKIQKCDVRERFYSFWAPRNGNKLASFCNDLSVLLTKSLPIAWNQRVDRLIDDFKASSVSSCADKIGDYKKRLEELAQLEKVYTQYMQQEPARKAKVQRDIGNVRSTINGFLNDSLREIRSFYNSYTSTSNLESILRSRYSDKREAEEYAIGYVVEKLQDHLKVILQPKTEVVCRQTAIFLEGYRSSKYLSGEKINVGISFNEIGAFTAGLAQISAVGAVGAFASWGMIAGGSWLAANTTGIVAAIGTGLANLGVFVGTALTGVLSVLMAPIGIGVLAAAGLAIFELFRGPWQSRLAKKINEKLVEKRLLDKLEQAVSDYWRSSTRSFERGAAEVESQWQGSLNELRQQVENPEQGRIDIQKTLALLEEGKSFFSAIPWENENPDSRDNLLPES
jgi:hypothetical protein